MCLFGHFLLEMQTFVPFFLYSLGHYLGNFCAFLFQMNFFLKELLNYVANDIVLVHDSNDHFAHYENWKNVRIWLQSINVVVSCI